MIKIMIVDDMPIFLDYLEDCIDWRSYGFRICARAHDGREALEMMERYYPDVVLTDITMPYIDGIELSEMITQNYPDTSIILITGNNEFEYARKAVKLGVCDYIVKPFEKEELILSLLKLQDNINHALEIKNQKEEAEAGIREEHLRKLIFGRYPIEDRSYEKMAEESELHFVSDYFLVCTLRLKVDRMENLEQIMNWENIITNMLRGMIEVDGTYELFRDFENDIVLVLNFAREEDMKKYKAYELLDLVKVIKSQLALESTICVSSSCYGVAAVRTEYYNTLQLLGEREPEGFGKVWDDRKHKNFRKEAFYSLEVISSLSHALELLNLELIQEVIEAEWSRIHAYHDEEAEQRYLSAILSLLFTNIVNSGRSITDIFGSDFLPYEELQRPGTDLSARKDTVLKLYRRRIDYELDSANTKSHAVAEAAREYIHQHYADGDMNISDVARELFINQTYLRKMFKSEMGMTLSEYITKYRMHMAKQLILDTDKKLTQIAEEVGYSDISYFSKCFKKYYGVSPKNMTKHVYQRLEEE